VDLRSRRLGIVRRRHPRADREPRTTVRRGRSDRRRAPGAACALGHGHGGAGRTKAAPLHRLAATWVVAPLKIRYLVSLSSPRLRSPRCEKKTNQVPYCYPDRVTRGLLPARSLPGPRAARFGAAARSSSVFGSIVVRRPDPQALWTARASRTSPGARADLTFVRDETSGRARRQVDDERARGARRSPSPSIRRGASATADATFVARPDALQARRDLPPSRRRTGGGGELVRSVARGFRRRAGRDS